MIDVSELLDDEDFASMITVSRLGAGSFANEGVFAPGAPVVTSWDAVVQPVSQADKDNYLPEGERQSNAVKIFSNQPLYMADGNGVLADTLTWQRDHYRVAFAKPWNLHGQYFVIAVGYVP